VTTISNDDLTENPNKNFLFVSLLSLLVIVEDSSIILKYVGIFTVA